MAIDPVSLAVTVALTAAQMAMTASQHIEGPRVTDLNATVADYGTPVNYFKGTRWLTCPCFWAEDIREQKKRRKTKAGKFTEYNYFGTWAVHVADHAIAGIARIKFDGHLVYDANSPEQLFELGDDYDLAASLRFYFGTPDQLPDPRMQATVEAERGEGTCPAYRNQSFIVFEDIPLEKVGNRMPIVTVEAGHGGVVQAPIVLLDFENGIYTLNGETVTAADLIEEDPLGYGPFALTDIVPGTGWVMRGGVYNSTARLTDAATTAIGNDATFYTRFNTDLETLGLGEGVSIALYSYNGSETIGSIWSVLNGDTSDFHVYRFGVEGLIEGTPVLDTLVEGVEYNWEVRLDNDTARATSTLAGDTVSIDHTAYGPAATSYNFDMSRVNVTTELPPGSVVVSRISIGAQPPPVDSGDPDAGTALLSEVLADLCLRAGLSADDFDFSQLDTIEIDGFSWSQGSVKQIAAPLMDVFDFDIRPHDFKIEALLRGGTPQGTITDFAKAEPRHALDVTADSDLPRRVFFNFADIDSDQQTNTAVSQRRAEDVSTSREMTLDLTTLAMEPARARRYTDRYLRRQWFGRTKGSSTLTRQHLAIEPGDVWTPVFDGLPVTMVCTKLTIAADGTMPVEWKADVPGLNTLSSAPGAPALGIPPATIYAASATEGAVLDLPLLVDAHDQTVPFAYIAASPTEPGKAWPGAQFAQSDTGETESFVSDWDSLGSIEASEMGTVTDGLPDALPWVFDNGSTVEVVIYGGELVSTTEADMIEDGTLNLAAIGSEVVQFRTATLTAPYTYTLSGFLRGRRGTEWAMPDHVAGERFVLLAAAKKHALGASEIGDTDSYIAHTIGKAANEADAFDLTYTGASHKPYAPVDPVVAQSGADWAVNATRRTRVGGTTLNGQDVPLGETSEAWELDILDGSTVVRTIAATSLPVTYTEAQQIEDFGSPLGSAPNGRLYQMNPALNLRGYPLAI